VFLIEPVQICFYSLHREKKDKPEGVVYKKLVSVPAPLNVASETNTVPNFLFSFLPLALCL